MGTNLQAHKLKETLREETVGENKLITENPIKLSIIHLPVEQNLPIIIAYSFTFLTLGFILVKAAVIRSKLRNKLILKRAN